MEMECKCHQCQLVALLVDSGLPKCLSLITLDYFTNALDSVKVPEWLTSRLFPEDQASIEAECGPLLDGLNVKTFRVKNDSIINPFRPKILTRWIHYLKQQQLRTLITRACEADPRIYCPHTRCWHTRRTFVDDSDHDSKAISKCCSDAIRLWIWVDKAQSHRHYNWESFEEFQLKQEQRLISNDDIIWQSGLCILVVICWVCAVNFIRNGTFLSVPTSPQKMLLWP